MPQRRISSKAAFVSFASLATLLATGVLLTGFDHGNEARALAPSPQLDPPLTAVAPLDAGPPEQLPRGAIMPGFWAPAPHAKSGPPPPEVNGAAAVLIDEASGEVLFDKEAHQPRAPASLTKIATLVLALEYGSLDDEVLSDVDGASMRGSTIMGLEIGDRFSLRDLLYGMMLPSGNDAALVIGRHIAGSDAAFVWMMNDLLRRLDLHDSHFANPHGLGGGAQHYTSAYDLAMLARYGMSLPGFREIVTARSWAARGSRTIRLSNINTFLGSFAGADGVKTGYTRGAGPTLAASATRNGHRLYAVVLNSQSRNSDAQNLLNWAFSNFLWPSS